MKTSLKPFNTFGLDIQANNIVSVHNSEELYQAWQNAETSGQSVLLLGEGSNILFLEDFDGTIILNRLKGIHVEEQENHWLLRVGAGENWHELVKYTLENNMPGLENLALIPGCAGSAPIQNIGAYGVEFEKFSNYVDCIELSSGKMIRLTNSECCFSYRESIFKHTFKQYAIIAIGILLPKEWTPILNYGDLALLSKESVTPDLVFDVVSQIRRTKLPDPKITGNAGSFFKNPVISVERAKKFLIDHPNSPRYTQANGKIKLAAGWLIDQCDLKGFKIGGASVHHKQALVIINENNATSEDIVSLARHVRNTVGEKFNIWLEPEVRFIGGNGELDAVKNME